MKPLPVLRWCQDPHPQPQHVWAHCVVDEETVLGRRIWWWAAVCLCYSLAAAAAAVMNCLLSVLVDVRVCWAWWCCLFVALVVMAMAEWIGQVWVVRVQWKQEVGLEVRALLWKWRQGNALDESELMWQRPGLGEKELMVK